MEYFAEIVYGFRLLIIFAKSSIFDVWKCSKFSSKIVITLKLWKFPRQINVTSLDTCDSFTPLPVAYLLAILQLLFVKTRFSLGNNENFWTTRFHRTYGFFLVEWLIVLLQLSQNVVRISWKIYFYLESFH